MAMKRGRWFSILRTLSTLASCFAPLSVQAQITPGGANTTVTVQGQTFNITGGSQAGDGRNLFHLFRDFGLNDGQIANFISNPNIHNILAGVNGGNPSYINGLIQVLGGNSNLYLLNPAGMIFGPNAQLSVPAAFHASTASAVHFGGGIFDLNAVNDFSKLVGNPTAFDFITKGILINEGNLAVNPGQALSLSAHQIINTGTLSTPGGTVTLTAIPETGRVRISQTGMLLSLEIDQSQVPENGAVLAITLPQLLTGAQDRGLGNTMIQNPDGTISLVHDPNKLQIPMQGATTVLGGAIDVSNPLGIGGTVNVLANQTIALVGSQINASGNFGGGTVLVGGDYLGGTTGNNRLDSSFNAQHLFVDRFSVLNANGLGNGNGGTVINWADNTTVFEGFIAARGGWFSGDGGFVETSGDQLLHVTGNVDASAPKGDPGQWLLDPHNVRIENFFTIGGNFANGIFRPTLDNARISNAVINQALNSGTSVTITTGNTGNQAGDITVNAPIRKTAGGSSTLFLEAANSILVNADITSTAGPLNIRIKSDVDLNGAGAIRIANATLDSNGGNILIGGGPNLATAAAVGTATNIHGIELTRATIRAGTGDIRLFGQGFHGAPGQGIYQHSGSTVSTTSGTISYSGRGSNDNSSLFGNAAGIWLQGLGTAITSNAGIIRLFGDGGQTRSSNSHGILQSDGARVSSNREVTYTGVGGTNSFSGAGISLIGSGTAIIGGQLSLSGRGVTGGSNHGIVQRQGAVVGSNQGNIEYSGIGGNEGGYGIWLDGTDRNTTEIFATIGNIILTGRGGNGSSNNFGILQNGGSLVRVRPGGRGDITYNGQGGNGNDSNIGIFLNTPFTNARETAIQTDAGTILLNGTGGTSVGSGRENHGINIRQSGLVSSTGDIRLVGLGGAGSTQSHGILLEIGNIFSSRGSIFLTGSAQGAGATNVGILLRDSSTIAGGQGQIFLTGLGGGNAPSMRVDGGANSMANRTVTLTSLNNPIQLNALSISTTNLQINSPGLVTQTSNGRLLTTGLELLGQGNFSLTSPNNNTQTLAAQVSGSLSFTDRDGFQIGSVNSTQGLHVGDTLTLNHNGRVTQAPDAPILTPKLVILGQGDTALSSPNNQIQALSAQTSGDLTVINQTTLSINAINPSGIEASRSVYLQSLTGDIVLNQSIKATDEIKLIAAQKFINYAGKDALQAENRWLVYSPKPYLNVNGWKLLGGHQEYGGNPNSTPKFSGSGFVYTDTPPEIPDQVSTVLQGQEPPELPLVNQAPPVSPDQCSFLDHSNLLQIAPELVSPPLSQGC